MSAYAGSDGRWRVRQFEPLLNAIEAPVHTVKAHLYRSIINAQRGDIPFDRAEPRDDFILPLVGPVEAPVQPAELFTQEVDHFGVGIVAHAANITRRRNAANQHRVPIVKYLRAALILIIADIITSDSGYAVSPPDARCLAESIIGRVWR